MKISSEPCLVKDRSGERAIYQGKAVVVSLLNTGLMAVVSLALIDEWSDLNLARGNVREVGMEAARFVEDWAQRFRVKESYQVAVSEFRAFLSETARWIDQADMLDSLPKAEDGRLTDAVFWGMAEPLMTKGKSFLVRLESEAASVSADDGLLHRSYAQAGLHPLVLRAHFVYRTFAKPLGYAGDYEMVNQLLGDPRQGGSTYIQLVNATFLRARWPRRTATASTSWSTTSGAPWPWANRKAARCASSTLAAARRSSCSG